MARIGITEIKGVDGFTDFKLEARDLIKYTEKENSIPLFSIGTLVKFNDGECFILYADLQAYARQLFCTLEKDYSPRNLHYSRRDEEALKIIRLVKRLNAKLFDRQPFTLPAQIEI